MSRKLIRDAVHGDIELGALEIELMDTPEFQRLRDLATGLANPPRTSVSSSGGKRP